jgi:hypothetical protein
MTTDELEDLVISLRHQAGTWMGDEACEQLERLIQYTIKVHERSMMIEAKLKQGYRFVQTGSGQHSSN